MVLFGGVNWKVKWSAYRHLGDTWELGPETLTANKSDVSIATGGTQFLSLDAGATHAGRLYWILGSLTGNSPGISLASAIGNVTLPLTPDVWTDVTIVSANTRTLLRTKGPLGVSGKGLALFNVPSINNPAAIGVVFHHAYVVYDQQSNFYMASNPVTLKLVK